MIDTIGIKLHGANQHKKGLVHKMIAENTNQSLHLCVEHNELFMKLHNIKKQGFSITKILSREVIINDNNDINDVVTSQTTNQVNEHYVSTNKVRFQTAEYVKERTAKAFGKYKIRSSETDVTYSLNYEGGFMYFEFSVPKYLFGHNLAQFVPQCDSKTYFKNSSNITDWNTQKHLLFKRFNKFINLFLQDLFLNLELPYSANMNYVELTRIDLCYNQYFDNKEIALSFLNEQKKLKKNSKIYSPDTNVDFETTLAWRTQNGNYFKIYHKGTEYINQKHGDFKKHTEINNSLIDYLFKYKLQNSTKEVTLHDAFDIDISERVKSKKLIDDYSRYRKKIQMLLKKSVNGEKIHIDEKELNEMKQVLGLSEDLQFIDTLYLKKEMDKILRYEVSITGKYASYQFKNYIFRKNDRIHQEAKKIYKKVKRQLESKDRFSVKIPSYHMNLHNMYHKWFTKGNSVVMSKNPLLHAHNKRSSYDFDKTTNVYTISDAYKEFGLETLLEKSSVSPFTEPYLIHLVNNFRKLIDGFQIKQLEPFDDLEKRVNRYNSIAERNLTKYNSRPLIYSFLPAIQKSRFDKLIKKKNKEYIKPTDLLTEKDKQERGLQKMSYTNMNRFFNLMVDEKKSANQIQKELRLSKGQYYRFRKNLTLLGLSEQHVNMQIPVNPKIDFFTYYARTSTQRHKKSFFLRKNHSQYDY